MKEKIRKILEDLWDDGGLPLVDEDCDRADAVNRAFASILALMPRCDIDKMWKDGHIDDVAHFVLSSVIQPLPAAPEVEE